MCDLCGDNSVRDYTHAKSKKHVKKLFEFIKNKEKENKLWYKNEYN